MLKGQALPYRLASSSRGFTIVELMTVVLVSAILLAIAVPGFQVFVGNSAVQSAQASVRTAIETARSEALTRGVPVGLCRSINAGDAAPACSAAAGLGAGALDWSVGWLIYAKAPANTADVFEAGDQLILRQTPPWADAAAPRAMIWAPAAGALVYGWNGLRVAGVQGTFTVDYGPPTAALPATLRSARAACLHVSVAGRLEARNPAAGVCP
jgi:type IV fimbrial biogenesis protein FimT